MAINKTIKPIVLEKITIVKKIKVTDDHFLMWLEKPAGFTHKSGKYCTIGVDGIERAYSMASAPHEEYIELFIERIPEPDGLLSPMLYRLEVGDMVTIRPRAKGLFTMDPSYTNQVMVATVTGVAPYVSYIRDYIHSGNKGHSFHILDGASYCNEFIYDKELQEISEKYPELLTFVPTVSRPDDPINSEWTGRTGRVNMIVEDYIEKIGFSPEDTLIYTCGHPSMIEDIKQKMTPKGFKVKFERYWKED